MKESMTQYTIKLKRYRLFNDSILTCTNKIGSTKTKKKYSINTSNIILDKQTTCNCRYYKSTKGKKY